MSTLIYDTLIVPGASVPTHDGAIGKDGIATLANLAAIQAITTPYKTAFMRRIALDTGIVWELQADLATWISIGGGGDTRTAWSVNSATGNDAAFGDAGAPLRTLKELTRRLCGTGRGRMATPTHACTVTIAGNPGVTDPLSPMLLLSGDQKVTFKGTPVVVRSGTIATFTPANVTPGTEDIGQITDAGVASWTADKNRRIKITTAGARFGAIAWIAGNYSGAIGAVSQFTKATQFSETLVTPLPGDTYDIETVPQVVMGGVDLMGEQNSAAFSFCSAIFQDLKLGDNTGFVTVAPRVGSGVIVSYLNCHFATPLNQQNGEYYSFGCNYTAGMNVKNVLARVYSALINGASAFTYCLAQDGAQVSFGHGSIAWAGGGFLIYGSGSIVATDLQIHNTAAAAALNPFGDAVCVGKSATTYDRLVGGGSVTIAGETPYTTPGKLLGRNNAGLGLALGAGSRVAMEASALVSVTGAGGDFDTANGRTLGLVGVDPASNLTVASIDQTWANFAAARPAGFAGASINPRNGAMVVTE